MPAAVLSDRRAESDFRAVFGPGRSDTAAHRGGGSVRERNIARLIGLLGTEHERWFILDPATHRWAAGLAAVGLQGPFAALDGAYPTLAALSQAGLDGLLDAENPNPLSSFALDLDSDDPEFLFLDWSNEGRNFGTMVGTEASGLHLSAVRGPQDIHAAQEAFRDARL